LIKEEYVSATAFIPIEIKRLKPPTRPTIGGSANQRLKDGILPGNKACGCT
jgi:hypothetical protein